MPRKEETANRQDSQVAKDKTNVREDNIVSPNILEEPGGDYSGKGAREDVKEDADHHGQSSGTLAAIEDSDKEGANRQGRGSSYDSNVSDVIVVDTGNRAHPAPKKKA
jgi:hypothetical protein